MFPIEKHQHWDVLHRAGLPHDLSKRITAGVARLEIDNDHIGFEIPQEGFGFRRIRRCANRRVRGEPETGVIEDRSVARDDEDPHRLLLAGHLRPDGGVRVVRPNLLAERAEQPLDIEVETRFHGLKAPE